MATLQEQIDELRSQLTTLQSDIDKRAKKSDINTINVGISAAQEVLETKLTSLEGCLRELQSGLIDARNELGSHTH